MSDHDGECHRCWSPLEVCPVCKGDKHVWGMFGECTECDGTGRVCPSDGKHWK